MTRSARRIKPAVIVAPALASIEVSEEKGVRYLHFGSHWIQGAMRVRRPHALELEYTRDMMFPLLLSPPDEWPRQVLQIGLGAGSITRFLHRFVKTAALTVVEIDARVVAAARDQFRLPSDPERVAIEIADGAAYVSRGGPRFDWMILDGFDARGLAGALDTRGFYAACRARLAPDGILVTNLLRRSRSCDASLARLRMAFDDRVAVLPTCVSGNTIAIAATGLHRPLAQDGLRAAADHLKRETGLDLGATVKRFAAALPAAFPKGAPAFL